MHTGDERVSNRNEIHRYTSHLVNRFQWIAVEGLNIGNMTRSGGNKHGLEPGNSITRVGNSSASQLHYKAGWAGRWIVEVAPQIHKSQLCSVCGIKGIRNGQGVLLSLIAFRVIDADWNAS